MNFSLYANMAGFSKTVTYAFSQVNRNVKLSLEDGKFFTHFITEWNNNNNNNKMVITVCQHPYLEVIRIDQNQTTTGIWSGLTMVFVNRCWHNIAVSGEQYDTGYRLHVPSVQFSRPAAYKLYYP